ncbi:SUPPRESSOR OF GAMMA RESPONSE 1-like [Bidens hawaiensis]|uniref:SUPPRESSOR OF GAMMA RESPONSE 1-like n=1 Tax=Bidens hawaiensis TaxID=980011 RepID=UPI004048EEA7
MAKSWIVNGRTLARKVKTPGLRITQQVKDCGANKECPKCHYKIDNSDVTVEWPGLPMGVKFEPSDAELLQHLAAKSGVGNEMPHQFIDEFIPTLDKDEGICYKHPENLPGARKDGNSVHFFYRTSNAYTTGQRKRRKICQESSLTKDVRWHKTGKTKAVMQNGVQIGCKKIMVLYGVGTGGSKPYKLNWVMHQYHLGTVEDEQDGQFVVAKIFYQSQKDAEKADNNVVVEKVDAWMNSTSPKTPKIDTPDPCRSGKLVSCDDVNNDNADQSPLQESVWCIEQTYLPSASNAVNKNNVELLIWEDDSQADDLDAFNDSLFGNENLDTNDFIGDSRPNNAPQSGSNVNADCAPGASSQYDDLENLDLGSLPDFNLTDLQFSSQDSIFWCREWK